MAGPAMTTAAAPQGPVTPEVTVEEDDVQAVALQGYGKLRGAAYLLLAIPDEAGDVARARAWLASLLPGVTFGGGRPDGEAVNVALTAEGFARLGLPAETVAGFSLEFQEGMTSPHRRRLLGDVGAAAPENWAWGGLATPAVHALLMIFAADDAALAPVVDRQRAAAEASGLRVLSVLDTQDLGFGEHFGFRDGLSQPTLAGTSRGTDGVPARDVLKPGEFLLGYPNEHDQLQRTPLVDASDDPGGVLGDRDFGRNGSYLVLRTLQQDVGAFWRFMDGATRRPDGTPDAAARTALAAHMVGRWPSGAPTTLAPASDAPGLAEVNDFAYHGTDAGGLGCPIGAHVRRTNPRDSLPPKPGEEGSVAVNKRHRLLRRGRPYGAAISVADALAEQDSSTASESDGEDGRGLHFVALCADLARQFEFVTHTWVLNPHFDGLYDDADPILGGHSEPGASVEGATFTRQARPVRRRVHDVPVFVTVRGGAYFFLPGRRALRFLASVPPEK